MAAFSTAFLRGEPRAVSLLPDDFRRVSARAAKVSLAAKRAVAAPVLAALRAQAAVLPMTDARREALSALEKPGTVVVATGQQVGLFLGPLYSLYKAMSAVVTAQALQRETGVRCVPVFWLQTEDHDLEEIDHLDLSLPRDAAPLLASPRFAGGGNTSLPLPAERGEGRGEGPVRLRVASEHVARASISGVKLGAQVDAALAELDELLADAPARDEVLTLLRRHYRPELTWSRAFAGVLSELVPELVLVDPRDEALAAHVFPVHQRALRECDEISSALSRRQAELRAAGFDVQVHVREGSPLSFLHPDGRDGPRCRVERHGTTWRTIGEARDVSPGDDPLCVSSSALLRPIIQDTLLPVAALIGGPGELNYFAQLPPLYAHFGLPMPMAVPRARFRIVEPRPASLLKKLGLTAAQLEAPRDEVLRRLAPVSPEQSPELLERRLLDVVEPVLDQVRGVDDAVKRTRATFVRAAGRLAGRYAAAQRTRDDTVVSRVERLQRVLFPREQPQERVLGFPEFAARLGVEPLLRMVRDALVPFSFDVVELPTVASESVAEARHASPARCRVGLVCHASLGGSSVIAAELGLALARRGHDVHFICAGEPPRLTAGASVTVHRVDVPTHPLFPHGEPGLALASKLIELGPQLDVIHVHYAIPLATSAVLARQVLGALAPKLITTVHGTDVLTAGQSPSLAPMVRHALEQSELVTAPSRFLAAQTLALAGVQVEVISNFVDTAHFVPGSEKPGPVLMHGSNFRALKRVRDVLEVHRLSGAAELVLAGDGPERAEAVRLAGPGVTFAGEQRDVVPYLQRARVFLLPSEVESFGLAALEAMSCGVPVVASRVGGLPEVIEDGVSGFLHDVGDVQAMAQSVKRLLTDDALHTRMAAAARERAVTHFQPGAIIERWEVVYAQLLEQPR